MEKTLASGPLFSEIPKISVCLIAKNEELFIRHCIESVRPIADEIIVLDTGSTDKTKEIVSRFNSHPNPLSEREGTRNSPLSFPSLVTVTEGNAGMVNSTIPAHPSTAVRLYETTWKDDFALAKNECMSYATGDWILFIDANEMLTPETRQAIIPLIQENDDKNEAVIICFKVNNLEPGNPEPTNYYLKQYLFKNGFGIHYYGAVHESLIADDTVIKIIKCPFLSVQHFDSPGKKDKIKYYANLSEKIIADPDFNLSVKRPHYFHLAICYTNMGNYDKALEIQKKAYNLFKNETKLQNIPLFITLLSEMSANLILNFGKSKEAIEYLEEARQFQKDFPDTLFFLGLAYLSLGKYTQMIETYSTLVEILENGSFEESFHEYSSRGKSLLPRVYLELGRVLVINGENSRGLECILKAHQLFPGKREILIPLIAHYALNDHLDKAIYYYLKSRNDFTNQDKINLENARALPAGSGEFKKLQSDLLLGLLKLDAWHGEERQNIIDKINGL